MIGKSFGQHEPLTTRLHNLVRSYPKGLGILKEFIQNADDAEANEIFFIIDEQNYEIAGLPTSMQWLHTTPALLVYNNRPFSESDIQGIQNIGESGKSESVGKTGRFGLGFNACYNVTDVPCFFTRGDLHFFDPHFQTLPHASLQSPGRCFGVDELIGEGWPLLDGFRRFVMDGSGFDGTVFRLPFRTTQQASTSRIKKDAYTVADTLDAVRELQEMGSAILLFLKHIRLLKVERWNRDGSVVNLLTMQATNPKEILKSRAEVNELLSSPDPDRILMELSKRGQVYSSCRHEYSVLAEGVEHTETWRVIDGFFTDDEHQVISACRKMIQNEEKALPYAGVAWPLDPGSRAAGKIFCFLPIPIQTNMPIQINGYFDLDDSRQNMFLDPSAHGAAGHRVQWNKSLLENSVVQAYITLLKDLRSDLGDDRIDSYYRAFPRAVVKEASWEGWLTAAFYTHATLAELFRVSGETLWSVLSKTRSLTKELLTIGDVLIAENFLPIPHPPLPDHIQNGFAINGIDIPELTPNDLRIQLKEQMDVDCPIEVAPRACLRKREYIEQIFRFCLSDSPKEGILGLPLVIDCRGYIRTLGFTESPLYLMGQSWDIEVFRDHPKWFVDPKFSEDLDLVQNEKVGLLDMDSECFVRELSKYVTALNENGEFKMSTSRAGALTDAWLQAVFSRLLESSLNKLKTDIKEIPLIPDQSRVLHPMGYTFTPLLFRGHKEDLKRALTDLSVPLVTGVSNKLFKLLLDFSEKEDLLWQVTPRDLVDTLEYCSENLQEYDQVTDIQRAILDYLSNDESLTELKNLTNQQDKLKDLRLFPTPRGDLVSLSKTAYVSQNFKFPSVDLDVVLLDYSQSYRWRNLYILLGAPELSRSRLIHELLLPRFVQLDAVARVEASAWLRDNLSIAQSEDETDDSDGLFVEVRNTPFIVCEDGELRAPMSVYQPESKLASVVLGDQAAFPDMDTTYAKSRERWLEFFRQLDMPTEPRLVDVVKYVRTLIADISYDHKTDRFQAVYEFIKGCVDAEIKERKDISDELSDVLEELAAIPWIPIRQEAGKLLCFKPAEVLYARPGDVYFSRIGQLLASQVCITDLRPEPNKLTRKAMGFPVKTPVTLVIKHFQEVLHAFSTQEIMPNELALVKVLAQIYRFFGGKAPSEADELDEEDIEYQNTNDTVDLEAKFSKIPCIWDQENNCFWQPDHVFTENVRYMEPWRRTIRSSEDAIELGYAALGRRQEPTIEDWKQVLEEISESGKSLLTHAEVISEVVRHIVKELDNGEVTDGTVLVPTRNWRMLSAETVFIADAPWYESMLDAWDIPILSSSVSSIWRIHRVLKIPSLADSIKQRLIEYPAESDLDDVCRECFRLESLLRSNEFSLGLQRLLQHEGHEVSENYLSYLREVDVRCVKAIKTCLYLQFDGIERLLGDAEVGFYWDHEALQAMLAENRYRYFCNDLAEMLNRGLGDRLKNLAPLVHVLQCEPSEILGVFDDLKIRKYSFDLEEKYKDDTEVAPQEFPDDENEGMDQYQSGKSEGSKVLVSDDDEPMYENEPENDEAGHPKDYSEQGEQSGQPHGISTGTGSRRPEKGQPSDNSVGWTPSDAPRSRTPSGTGKIGHGHNTLGRSDMETDQSTDGVGGSLMQSTASNRQPTTQRRLLSYVSHGGQDGDKNDSLSGGDIRSLRIGKAAVEIVIEHEKKNGRKARSMAHANPGYDVISECEGETRYIEVKGTEAAWGERGVVLTPTQLFYARENPDRDYWLYVVEDVFSQTPLIHKIHNPSEKVSFFVFDGGWIQVAESAQEKRIQMPIPSPGDEVLLNGKVVGIVETICRAGKFPLIIYRAIDGSQQRKLLADLIVRSKEEE